MSKRHSHELLALNIAAPPRWMGSAHLQTILPALWFGRSAHWLGARRERWATPDKDFLDVDRLEPREGSGSHPLPLLVLFHGLEGSISSHYALSFAVRCLMLGWGFALPHFRGCSGTINLAPRAYHSGDHEEIDWILRRFRKESPQRPVFAVGVSLGGNALMKWAGTQGDAAASVVAAVASVCAPLDLSACGFAMGQGFNRAVYTRMFLRTMLPKAEAKWRQHPGLFDIERVKAAATLYEFDDAFTARLHGFASAEDYWTRASAKPSLSHIRLPCLLLNALNDPFVPSGSLPVASELPDAIRLWTPSHGGHVGFPSVHGKLKCGFRADEMPRAVVSWLASTL